MKQRLTNKIRIAINAENKIIRFKTKQAQNNQNIELFFLFSGIFTICQERFSQTTT